MINKIKKILSKIGNILAIVGQFIWGIIQSLVGAILLLIAKKMNKVISVTNYKTVMLVNLDKSFLKGTTFRGVSLGGFIFIVKDLLGDETEEIIKHEYGHCLQSLLLGPLYLLVIGLSSVIWNVFFKKYRVEKKVNYYSFYTEKWADYLVGIKR